MRASVLIAAGTMMLVISGPAYAQTSGAKLLKIDLPLSESTACLAARRWASASGQLVGVECMREDKPGIDPSRVKQTMDLTGLSPDTALQMILKQLPGYGMRHNGGVTVIRPAGAQGRHTMLDRVVPDFTLSAASLVDAAEAINRLFDPAYHIIRMPLHQSQSSDENRRKQLNQFYAAYNKRFEPMVSMRLSNVTVEDILSEVSKQTGVSWQVQFTGPNRQYGDSIIDFIAPGGPIRSGQRVTQSAK